MNDKIYYDETINKCKRCIKLHNIDGLISLVAINRKLANTATFIKHVRGSARAIKLAIKHLIADGFINEIGPGIYKVNQNGN